jgi:hypothetical protein
MRSAVHFVPIVTTLFAAAFAVAVLRRHRERGGTHLLWWGIGLIAYGAGTLVESLTTLFGWHEGLFRAWYITGALLGGAPLAQGSVYLHLSRRTADRLSWIVGTVIAVAAVCVLLSPIRMELVEPYRLSGRVLGWTWVRGFSPFINTYAAIFLIGGAVISAVRFSRTREMYHRFVGNVFIAVGGLLPGIGGTFTRFGHVEVLYVTELLGLACIWVGFRLNTRSSTKPVAGARATPQVA